MRRNRIMARPRQQNKAARRKRTGSLLPRQSIGRLYREAKSIADNFLVQVPQESARGTDPQEADCIWLIFVVGSRSRPSRDICQRQPASNIATMIHKDSALKGSDVSSARTTASFRPRVWCWVLRQRMGLATTYWWRGSLAWSQGLCRWLRVSTCPCTPRQTPNRPTLHVSARNSNGRCGGAEGTDGNLCRSWSRPALAKRSPTNSWPMMP